MAEREVRYCTTADGVSIAYWVRGAGPPLVYVSEPVLTSSEGDYRLEKTREWFEAVGDGRMLVRFDHRGTGLSHHNDDFTLNALRSDLEAVVDKVGLSSFDLWGDMDGGIVSSAYAAAHPDRVRRLILFNSWARAADVPESETLQTLDRLIGLNWPLYARTAATMDSGWSATEAEEYAGYIAAGCEPAVARKFVDATWEFDITPVLGRIACPTLVIHRKHHKYFPLSLGRTLAAGIPGARLVTVDGASFYPWFEDAESILQLAREFLADEGAESENKQRKQTVVSSATSTAVILFTDIANSTALTERMGDGGFRKMSRALDAGLRGAIRDAGGVTVEAKTLGDGVLATFGSAAQAIEGARRCLALSAASELGLHIGVHAGDVIREEGNVFGGAVNIAARICSLSEAGEILVSDVVRGMARTSAGVVFEDRGEREMKGVGEPVRVYAVVGG